MEVNFTVNLLFRHTMVASTELQLGSCSMTAAPQLAPALGETMYGQAQQGVWEIVGAVKVKDGLFIGDEMAAQVVTRLVSIPVVVETSF